MTTAEVFSAARSQETEDAIVVSGSIEGEDLVLEKQDNSTVNIPGVRSLTATEKVVTLSVDRTAVRQEGGTTLMLGTFVPISTVADIEVSCSFTLVPGWTGFGFSLNKAVLPAGTPPSSWDPVGEPYRSRISQLANYETPLAGVTEFSTHRLGHTPGGAYSLGHFSKRIRLTGLTPGRTYQWEVRVGATAGFISAKLPTGAQPKSLVNDGLKYTWASCVGVQELILIRWTEVLGEPSSHAPATIEAIGSMSDGYINSFPVARIKLDGDPGRISLSPDGILGAVWDITNAELVLFDRVALTVIGSYALPDSALPSYQTPKWVSADDIWVGTYDKGKIWHFDVPSKTFDTSITVDGATDHVFDYALSYDKAYMYAMKSSTAEIKKINLAAGTMTNWKTMSDWGVTMLQEREDGLVVFYNQNTHQVVTCNADGTTRASSGTGSSGTVSTLELNSDGTQAYWTDGARLGWSWVDPNNYINGFSWVGTGGQLGQVVIGENDSITFSAPWLDRVLHIPGARLWVHPESGWPQELQYLVVTANGVSELTDG